jgi:hypothetical protein
MKETCGVVQISLGISSLNKGCKDISRTSHTISCVSSLSYVHFKRWMSSGLMAYVHMKWKRSTTNEWEALVRFETWWRILSMISEIHEWLVKLWANVLVPSWAWIRKARNLKKLICFFTRNVGKAILMHEWNPISAKISCPQVAQKGECTPKLGWVVTCCESCR